MLYEWINGVDVFLIHESNISLLNNAFRYAIRTKKKKEAEQKRKATTNETQKYVYRL